MTAQDVRDTIAREIRAKRQAQRRFIGRWACEPEFCAAYRAEIRSAIMALQELAWDHYETDQSGERARRRAYDRRMRGE